MLPSRCFRCGGVSREALCPSCIDYLVAYHPLWLDPSLLPGPSLLDLLGPREVPLLAADGGRMEWRSSPHEASPADAVRLVRMLRLEADPHPLLSAGDAEILHRFLDQGRRATPSDPAQRDALAVLYRYLAARDWIPEHLAEDYRIRARALAPAAEAPEPAPESVTHIEEVSIEEMEELLAAPEEGAAPAAPADESAPSPEDLEETEEPEPLLPAPEPQPEPAPTPEPPLPLPAPEPVPPPPEPEPEPEPEEAAPSPPAQPAAAAPEPDLARVREAVDRERQSVQEWVHSRTEAFEAKERDLADREKLLEDRTRTVEEQVKTLQSRLLAFEKDESRREVLLFLSKIPGISADEASVIAEAFPDMPALRAADAKALTQCRGVGERLARAIRFELVPGEVEVEQRVIDLREQAQAFLEEGDYRASLDCYARLSEERPEDVSLWFDKAELHVLLDQPEDALQCYQRVLTLDPRNRQAWFERANLLFGMGRMADAVDALREALKIDGTKSADIALKAEQLRRDGHANEAAILYQAVLDVDAENPRAILGLGDTLLDLGDLEAAEALLTRALGRRGGDPQVLFRKGELLRRKGRWGAAVQFYNRAIAIKWDYPEPWMSKGEVLLEHDRAQEALECMDKVLTFDSRRAAAWARKALAHHTIHQRTEAARALEEASRIDSADPAVVAARRVLGEDRPASPPARAPPEVEAPARDEAHPDEPSATGGESQAPSLADAWKEAVGAEQPPTEAGGAAPSDIKSFVESVEPEREETHVLLQLAELALEGGDAEMALLRYEQAVGRDPRSADAWTGKGTALQHLERYEEALEAYDHALAIDSGHETARRWRETCLRHLKREGSE